MMRSGVSCLFAFCLVFGVHANDNPHDEPEPVSVSLFDQHDRPFKFSSPPAKPTVITIADRGGVSQLPGWIEPLQREFGDRIAFLPIADVGGVPGPLRGLIRRTFVKDADYPIGLDWSGETIAQFGPVDGEANIILLDPTGRIGTSMHGAAVAAQLDQLRALIREQLADGREPAKEQDDE